MERRFHHDIVIKNLMMASNSCIPHCQLSKIIYNIAVAYFIYKKYSYIVHVRALYIQVVDILTGCCKQAVQTHSTL